ncbi:unnamed protein product [Schistosoma haematobium]|nr:unnamed protein product [Schistosoma haematobium]
MLTECPQKAPTIEEIFYPMELLQVYWHERVALDVKLLDLRWLDLRPDSACYEITIFLSRANTSYVYEIINIAYLHAVDLIH